MDIINLPENLFEGNYNSSELQIANYEVYKNASKNKINLNKNVISFLLDGQKDIHFSNDIVSINDTQSLLISSSNFLLKLNFSAKISEKILKICQIENGFLLESSFSFGISVII